MTERNDIQFEWIEPENPAAPSDGRPDIRDIWSEVDKKESTLLSRIRWKTLGKMAVYSSAIVGGAVVSEYVPTNIEISIGSRQQAAPIIQIIEKTRTCPPVTEAKLAKIKSLLSSSWNEPLSEILNKPSSEYYYQQYVEKQQQKYGFTPVDGSTVQGGLEFSRNVDEVLDNLSKFTMNRYGFDVVLYNNTVGTKNVNATEMRPDDIDVGLLGRNAQSLISAFDFLPLEEVRAFGIKQIRVVSKFSDEEVAAEALVEEGIIDIRLDEYYNSNDRGTMANVLYHEAGHIMHYKTCNPWGFENDPKYAELNPPGFKYGDNKDWKRATLSAYAASDLAEDVAVTYESILDTLDPNAFHSSYRAVREKYALLLARLDQQVPGIAEYLIAISPHKK